MSCYRSGGCGPYEMTPCNECPYSKSPEKTRGTDIVCPVCGHIIEYNAYYGRYKCTSCEWESGKVPSEKEQLEFAIECLRGVCAACKHYGTPEDQTPCSICGIAPGFGLWEWKFDPDSELNN